MSDTASTFLQFPQLGLTPKASYWPWLRRARAIFLNTGLRQYGHIGLTMTAAEYALFHESMLGPVAEPVAGQPVPPARAALVPYAALLPPEEDFRIFAPVDPAADAAAQRNADAISLSNFNRIHTRFEKEQAEIIELRNRLMASISTATEQAASDSIDGFTYISTDTIFQLMQARFGYLVASEVAALEQSLEAKWTSGSITSHIAVHRQVHDILAYNRSEVSTAARIHRLTTSLSACPVTDTAHPFHVEIVAYRISHPNLDDLLFEDFALIIERAGADLLPVPVSAISSAKTVVAKKKRIFNCSFHGKDSSHDSAHCRVLAEQARHASGGGKPN